MLSFQSPYFLIFLVIIPILFYWFFRKEYSRGGTIRFPNLDVVKRVNTSRARRAKIVLFLIRAVAITLIILAVARPQSGSREEEVITEGIDIILAMDVSTSMRAEDFKPKNRLQAAKVVAGDFINGRKNDRIGMVVFAGNSFTQCPLTLDYSIVLKFLDEIETGMIEDGTAIGMAIGNCVNRLKDSKAKSKVVILLTDGRNNRGELDPITASYVAETFDIKIYTIGAGKRGEALYPIDDPIFGTRYVRMPVEIDEDLLKKIAGITLGKYFRATDEEKLDQIYKEISNMEKTEIKVRQYTRYSEMFAYFLNPVIFLIIIEIFLSNTIFRKIP